MSTTTSTLGLTKSELSDAADITAFNENWDKLDSMTNTFSRGVVTGGTGEAYTANVPGITELVPGLSFIMIPHVRSTSRTPSLDVNGLGAKNIRQVLANQYTSANVAGAVDNWLVENFPVRITYDGTQWKIDITRPSAGNLYGKVAVENGGTGAETVVDARKNLEVAQAIEHPSYPGCYRRKIEEDKYEWINPPMIIEEEYRTTERWDGKPVYKKLVKFSGPAAGNSQHGKQFITNDSNAELIYPIRFEATIISGGSSIVFPGFSDYDFEVTSQGSIIYGASTAHPNDEIRATVWYVYN